MGTGDLKIFKLIVLGYFFGPFAFQSMLRLNNYSTWKIVGKVNETRS
jgi:hypothetical protein